MYVGNSIDMSWPSARSSYSNALVLPTQIIEKKGSWFECGTTFYYHYNYSCWFYWIYAIYISIPLSLEVKNRDFVSVYQMSYLVFAVLVWLCRLRKQALLEYLLRDKATSWRLKGKDPTGTLNTSTYLTLECDLLTGKISIHISRVFWHKGMVGLTTRSKLT